MSELSETVERMLVVYNRHDGAGFASFFAEDGVLRVIATGDVRQGRDQIQAGMEEIWRGLDYTLETRGLYESGGHVWLEWTMNGRNVGDFMGVPATHRRFEGLLGCSHYTFGADGLFTQDDVYFDGATMLRQIGHLPE